MNQGRSPASPLVSLPGLFPIGAAVALFLWSLGALGITLDDALIYQEYIRNYLENGVLQYNLGESRNALTSPLFTGLALLANALLGESPRSTNLVSALFYAATYLAMVLTLRHLVGRGRPLFVASAALFVLFLVCPYFYLTFGLETTLLTFLVFLAVHLFSGNAYGAAAFAAGLATATRTEASLLALVFLAFFLYREARTPGFPRRLAMVAGLYALPVVLVAIGPNLLLFGEPLAHTGMVKLWQGQSGLFGDGTRFAFFYIGYLHDLAFLGSVAFPVAALAFAVMGFHHSRRKGTTWVLAGFAGAYLAVFAGLNIPAYHWYYAVFMALFALFAAVGVTRVSLAGGPAPVAVRLLVLGVLAWGSVDLALGFSPRDLHPDRVYVETGEWLRDNTPEDATVACREIGHIGYFSRRDIVDVMGLVSPLNGRLVSRRCFHDWLYHYQPDYMVIRDPPAPAEQSATWLLEQGYYGKVKDIRNQDVLQRLVDPGVIRDGVRDRLECAPD